MAYTNFYPKTGVSGNAGTSGKPGYSGDIGIDYIDYLAEKLNDSVKYTEHISNSINNSVNYSDFSQNNSYSIKSQYEFWGGNTGELTTSFIPFMFNDEIAIKRARSIKLGFAQFNDSLLLNPSIQNLNHIQAYPNPSNGIFYLNFRELGIKSWSVSDLNGRILKMNESMVQSGVIDLTDLPRGIYLLRVTTSDAQSFQKLIKQ